MDIAGRIDATYKLMEQQDVDVLLVAPNELGRIDAIFHLSGYRGLGDRLAILRRREKPILVMTPQWEVERARERAPLWDIRGVEALADELAAVLGTRKSTGKIATVGFSRLRARLGTTLGGVVGKDAKNLDHLFEHALMPKTSDEIEHARHATAIAEKAFERLLEITHVGMSEAELAVRLKLYMEALGADDNFFLITAAPHNRAVQPSSGRKIEKGDIILVEMTPTYYGQLSQICRTAIVGAPSDLLSEKYALVVRSMEAGIRTVKPGIKMSDVANAIDAVLSEQGYAEFCRPPHIRRRGHGLGRGSDAPGDVAPYNDTILREDMIFVVHPNQYLPETGYLMCGEPVRVTANGVEQLTKRTAHLATVCA